MSALLLRLAGPMQSWGTQSRFTVRDTGMEPSKSGVIGLLCAALGVPRMIPLDRVPLGDTYFEPEGVNAFDLTSLRMGARVDKEGVLKRDYQTAGGGWFRGEPYGVALADGKRGEKSGRTVLSNRYYLADADFLVALEGGDDLLNKLQDALGAPYWQLFLGRKAFVPGVPVYIPGGLKSGLSMEEALWGSQAERWPRWDVPLPPVRLRPDTLRFVLETNDPADGDARMDQPYGNAFDLDVRRERPKFVPRYVRNDFKQLGEGPDQVPVRT